MNANDFLKERINEALEYKMFNNAKELAEKAGVAQGNLSDFLNGKRAGFNFDTAYKLLKVIGYNIEEKNSKIFQKENEATIHRMGTFSPIEEIKENDNVVYVPICSYAGCGGEVDYNNVPESELVPILKTYWQHDLRIIKVIGDSMEPTIKENSLVGVVPCTGNLKAGKVYLVNIPNFGLVIKRVYPGQKQGTILLSSDNKHHADRIIDCNGFDNVIVAEIVWVLQNM